MPGFDSLMLRQKMQTRKGLRLFYAFLYLAVHWQQLNIINTIRIYKQNKSHPRFQFTIQKNFSLKAYSPQFLLCIGDFHGTEALQVGADRGGMGDDESGFAIRQIRQDIPDTGGHPGVDFTEGLPVGIFKIWVFILSFPERDVLSGRIASLSLKKP